MDKKMKQKMDEVPLSESNLPLTLADVQRRCWRLLGEPDEVIGLSLEDPIVVRDGSNPYNRG